MTPTDDVPPLPPQRHSNRSRNNDSRCFEVADEGWYLRTREGTRGPFESRELAERFLAELIRSQSRRHAPAP